MSSPDLIRFDTEKQFQMLWHSSTKQFLPIGETQYHFTIHNANPWLFSVLKLLQYCQGGNLGCHCIKVNVQPQIHWIWQSKQGFFDHQLNYAEQCCGDKWRLWIFFEGVEIVLCKLRQLHFRSHYTKFTTDYRQTYLTWVCGTSPCVSLLIFKSTFDFKPWVC